MATLKHYHTYKKVRQGSNQFRCQHPECSHLTVKDLIEGKKAICNGCAKEFILDNEALKRIYPKCSDCIDLGRKIAPRIEEDIVEEIILDLKVGS